jgi:hypothetical protein
MEKDVEKDERLTNAMIARKFMEIYDDPEAYKLASKAIKKMDFDSWMKACDLVGIPPGQAQKAFNYIKNAAIGNNW